MPATFWESIVACLPADLKAQVLSLAANPDAQNTIDSLLRFAFQQNSPAAAATASDEWHRCQNQWAARLQEIRSTSAGTDVGSNLKRAVSPNGDATANSSKKPKLSAPEPVTGTPLYTIHGISCTSPLRKKLDITIGTDFISFAQPNTGVLESSVKLRDLDKAFLLPTPGKSKAYYTVVLLSTASPSANDAKAAKLSTPTVEQIIFGIDAVTTAAIKTTEYSSGNSNGPPKISTTPKAAYTLPLLERFTSNLPAGVQFHDASRSSFRSGLNKDDFCITAYLRAKEGHLYFFKEGVLFGEKKPCVWFKVEDMRSVRVVSATGKTASVYIETAVETPPGEEVDPEEEGDTVEFGMIDGREMEGIRKWVRMVEARFYDPSRSLGNAAPDGEKPRAQSSHASSVGDASLGNGVEGEDEDGEKGADEEESDDEDFKVDSDSDGGEPSSDSDSDSQGSGGGGGGGDDDGDEEEDDGDGSGSDGEQEELDKARHPLLRPGAMPKMSKAALNAAVGIVERDFGLAPAGGDERDELMSD